MGLQSCPQEMGLELKGRKGTSEAFVLFNILLWKISNIHQSKECNSEFSVSLVSSPTVTNSPNLFHVQPLPHRGFQANPRHRVIPAHKT